MRLIEASRARCSGSGCRLPIVVAVLYASMFFAMIWTVLTLMRYSDPGEATNSYCQQNHLMKKEMGMLDILDDPSSVCNSTIVLSFSLEELEPRIRSVYLAQAVTGALLVTSVPLALVGVFLRRRALLVAWATADVIWCVTLVISIAVLAPFGYKTYILIMSVSVVCCLFGCCLVLCFGMRNMDRLRLRREDQESGEQDPERREGLKLDEDPACGGEDPECQDECLKSVEKDPDEPK